MIDQNEAEEVLRILQMTGTLSNQQIEVLQHAECWAPLTEHLQKKVDDKEQHKTHQMKLAEIYGKRLGVPEKTADICERICRDYKFNFRHLVEEMIPRVVERDDFDTEVVVLETMSRNFKGTKDRVKCMERLCLIYEKKIFNDNKLSQTYERLIGEDPQNVKALRYFRLVYTQNRQWDLVADVLKKLLNSVVYKHEIYRVALELAAVYVYNTNQASQGLAVLDKYCRDSPLDTKSVYYDAYQLLGDVKGCERILRTSLLSLENDDEIATVHYKLGCLAIDAHDYARAREELLKSLSFHQRLFPAYDKLVQVYLAVGDKASLGKLLKQLYSHLVLDTSKSKVTSLLKFFKDTTDRAI